jgi:hypothetical protein
MVVFRAISLQALMLLKFLIYPTSCHSRIAKPAYFFSVIVAFDSAYFVL